MLKKIRIIVSFSGARSRVFQRYVSPEILEWLKSAERVDNLDSNSPGLKIVELESLESTFLHDLESLIEKAKEDVYREAMRGSKKNKQQKGE